MVSKEHPIVTWLRILADHVWHYPNDIQPEWLRELSEAGGNFALFHMLRRIAYAIEAGEPLAPPPPTTPTGKPSLSFPGDGVLSELWFPKSMHVVQRDVTPTIAEVTVYAEDAPTSHWEQIKARIESLIDDRTAALRAERDEALADAEATSEINAIAQANIDSLQDELQRLRRENDALQRP